MLVSSQAGIDDATSGGAGTRGRCARVSELVKRYEGKVFRLAHHVTQNRETPRTFCRETFLKAYEHLDQFRGDSKFYTWIVRIAVNQALMKLRRRKSDNAVSLDETIDTGEDNIVREIAVWDENAEQRYSRKRSAGFWIRRSRVWSRCTGRFSCCGISRPFHRRDGGSSGPLGAGREEPVVAGAFATA